MKDNKTNQVGVKLTDRQIAVLNELITGGKAKTKASAIQYLIDQYQILNGK
ncbi:hypothetical protein [Cedecea lapagei]|uniref:hypothetical protein n=1 Tax=Cedecea lapagei TaxID=158823 RepID=UPI001BCAD505|nr:hypothetical protein [Cedecea lapagei]